ncbi:hypothetical protein [Pontimicrobium sp. MEBiC06410]
MSRDGYFWCADMLIVPDLKIESIKTVFNKMLEDEEVDFDIILSEIGSIIKIYGVEAVYDNLEDDI